MSIDKSLSRQEERVLNLAKQGFGDKQIAQQLGLSTDTVRTYWQRIRQKVGAATRAEIIATVGDKQTAAAIEAVENEKTALQQEIAHRQSTEKALRASEAEWRRLADSMPQMVFVARADGVIFHHNARFYEFTGLTPEEAKGEGLYQVIHPDDLDSYLAKAQKGIQTGQPYEEEIRIKRHDGVYLWHVNRTAPYRNDQFEIVRWYGTSTDIHDSKLVREQMQRNEARVLLAQQIASLGYFEYRVDTHEALWSPNLSAMFELPERTDWFDSNEFLDLVMAEDREAVGAAILRTLREGIPFDAFYRVKLASGRVLHVHSIAKAFVEDGQITRIVGTIQDVTEQTKGDIARRISEGRFQAITEASPHGIFVSDVTGDCLYTNARYLEITGLTEEEARCMGWVRCLHPDDRERIVRKWQNVTERQATFADEYRLVHPDGTEKWVFVNTATFQLDKETVGHVGVVQDITERKSTEAERERLINIVESTPDIVVMIDPSLKTIAMNEAARQFFDVKEHEIGAVSMQETHPAWAWEKVMNEGLPHALEHGTWTGETALLDRDGREVPISKVIIAHRDAKGELVYVSAIARNISEIKGMESELNTQRRFAEQVLDSSFDIVYIYDIQRRQAVYANRAIQEIWGYPLEDMMNVQGDTLRQMIHPIDLARIETHLDCLRSLQDGEVQENEFRILTKHRGWRWMQSRESVFRRDENGALSQILGVVQDVTHRKGPVTD